MVAMQLDEETVKKVIRQVEFYFSDSNLPRDDFLKKTIAESEDGSKTEVEKRISQVLSPILQVMCIMCLFECKNVSLCQMLFMIFLTESTVVSLALICSFSRMRGHLSLGDVKVEDVPEDTVAAVAETLKNSTTVKISEDGKKVGRTTELPKVEEAIEQLDSRTIAASPLEYDIKLEDVESFFGQYFKVNSVRLPRHVSDKKLFCGTALIEFSCEEDATKILTEKLVFRGAELELKTKKEFDEKRAEQEEAENTRRTMIQNRKNGSQEEEYPKGLIVAFKLKSLTCEDSKAEKTEEKPESMELVTEAKVELKSGSENEESEDKKESSESEEKPEAKKMSADMYKGNKDVVLREDLKSVFQKFGTVKYIDFKMGEESGYIRFEEAEGSQKARAAAVLAEEGGLIVKNYVAILDNVTGEDEKKYWTMLRSQDKFRGNSKGNWGRGGGRNNRGGRQFNGKNNRSRDNNNNNNNSGNRPNKFQKVVAA
ncbi:hypothetical protein LXL04_015629 [Taraxacum kok-saghyz]